MPTSLKFLQQFAHFFGATLQHIILKTTVNLKDNNLLLGLSYYKLPLQNDTAKPYYDLDKSNCYKKQTA